jgi:hypothetical protein
MISALWAGADVTGVTDSTAAIQAAITAAGVNGTVYIPAGTYLLSATLVALANQRILGAGKNSTIFRRFTNYGDTLYFASAGTAYVSGIWFWHGVVPSNSTTHLSDRATSGSHIDFANFQAAVVEECWFWRMPYGITLQQGAMHLIKNCLFNQYWNSFPAADSTTHEGVAGVAIGTAAYTQLCRVDNCYFAGPGAGPQSVTYTSTDTGAHVQALSQGSAASLYGILVNACEGVEITNNYLGGHTQNNILFATSITTSEVRVHDNFFDSAGWNSPCVYFAPAVNGQYASMVSIAGNIFDIEEYGFQAIAAINTHGTSPSVAGLTIIGNTIQALVGSAIVLNQAEGALIASNNIYGYNCLNFSAGGDANFSAAGNFINCTSVVVKDNLVGGGVSSDYPTSYCYNSFVKSGTFVNYVEKDTVWNGVGPSGIAISRVDEEVVVITGSYAIQGYESLLLAALTGSGAQVTLPSNIAKGYSITIKDVGGNFNSYPLAVIGVIDNVTNNVMSTNYQVKKFTWSGGEWYITNN